MDLKKDNLLIDRENNFIGTICKVFSDKTVLVRSNNENTYRLYREDEIERLKPTYTVNRDYEGYYYHGDIVLIGSDYYILSIPFLSLLPSFIKITNIDKGSFNSYSLDQTPERDIKNKISRKFYDHMLKYRSVKYITNISILLKDCGFIKND